MQNNMVMMIRTLIFKLKVELQLYGSYRTDATFRRTYFYFWFCVCLNDLFSVYLIVIQWILLHMMCNNK